MSPHHHHKEPETSTAIGPKTKVPLYVVGSAMVLACLLTAQWMDMRSLVMSGLKDSVTQDQAREWIENARLRNPMIDWPALPVKVLQSEELTVPTYQNFTSK